MALAWSWERKKSWASASNTIDKGQLLSACAPAVCGSSEARKDVCASETFFIRTELRQLHSWCEEARKRNKRRRMLNWVCPVSTFYMISKQTSKKLHYYHDNQVHLTKYIEEGNYCRMKCYHSLGGIYLYLRIPGKISMLYIGNICRLPNFFTKVT